MLAFERIDIDAFDWEKTLRSFPDRTIFQTPAWLAFIAKTQHAEPVAAALKDGSYTVGYFTGLMAQKLGCRILGSPFPGWTTSYMGLNLLPEVSRRAAMQALTRFAFKELQCAHVELMDRYLTFEDCQALGLEYRIYSGFEVDLAPSENDVFGNMTSACRRAIRKSLKSGVVVEEAHTLDFADEYYAQLTEVFAKQSLVPTYDAERVRQLISHLYPTGRLLLLRACDPQGHCIATGIFPAMHQTMYFWGGASCRESQALRPNEAIHWYAMRYWKARGMRRYDMAGGGAYKKKYGGAEICVPWIKASKHRAIAILRDAAQQLVRTRQKLAGMWKHG